MRQKERMKILMSLLKCGHKRPHYPLVVNELQYEFYWFTESPMGEICKEHQRLPSESLYGCDGSKKQHYRKASIKNRIKILQERPTAGLAVYTLCF